jgi:hypothetical protein
MDAHAALTKEQLMKEFPVDLVVSFAFCAIACATGCGSEVATQHEVPPDAGPDHASAIAFPAGTYPVCSVGTLSPDSNTFLNGGGFEPNTGLTQ